MLRFTQLWVKPKPKTSAYQNENQTQCHYTLIQHHAILYQKDVGVQHPFKLCQ